MEEKKIAFIASVKERELQLKIVIESVVNQVDLIHLVLNWYTEVPNWLKDDSKIVVHLNPDNVNAHDAIWNYLDAENAALKVENGNCDPIENSYGLQFGSYCFILDDDLLYPQNYIEKLIAAIERHERRAVITVHGTNFSRPVENYCKSRISYTFSDAMERDIFVDMTGCGTTAFHSSTIKPTLQNFPIPFNRDLYFSILCARQNIKIVSIQRPQGWILPLKTSGETVFDVTSKNKELQLVKERLLKEVLIPFLHPNSFPINGEEEKLLVFSNEEKKDLTKGLLYLAFGKEYDKLAAYTIAYSRRFTDLPICVLTNLEKKKRDPKWQEVKNVEFIFISMPLNSNRWVKTSLIDYSPFDLTLFMDCDSVIQKEGIEKIFDVMGDNDLLLHFYSCHQVGNLIMGIYKNLMQQLGMEPPISIYSSAFICFRKTKCVKNFFRLWNTYWDICDRGRDMPALACVVKNFKISKTITTRKDDLFSKERNEEAIVQHECGNVFFEKFGIPRFKENKPFDIGNEKDLEFVLFE